MKIGTFTAAWQSSNQIRKDELLRVPGIGPRGTRGTRPSEKERVPFSGYRVQTVLNLYSTPDPSRSSPQFSRRNNLE
jgi:hypothetical protein